MRIQRKQNKCLNCSTLLDSTYSFCPKCGQLNNDNNVSFQTLFTDFFSNYFALDSRFIHSFKPFFIKPGYLTNRFNEGKRMSYANPVRLYLLVSLFFFFIFSGVGENIASDEENEVISTSSSNKAASRLDNIEEITVDDLRELKATTGPGYKPIIRNLSKEDKKIIIENIGVDSAVMYGLTPADTVSFVRTKKDEEDMDFLGDGKFNWDLYADKLKDNDDLTHQQVLDSIYLGGAGDFELRVAKQRIKVERSESKYFISYALKNLPIMMFVLLPIFALILKLLYVRRKILYIKHLIHALHLHSFAYLTYGITLLISFYLVTNEDASVFINIFSFILVSTYAYISFLRVYNQHWFKTLIKFNIQGALYATILGIAFGVEMFISFMLY